MTITKPIRVKREELLQQLESVQPGLSKRDIVEQSSCFAFKNGLVMAYNDEVACSHKCLLTITGAVAAEPLIELLRKLPEDDLEFTVEEGELRVKGKRRAAGITMEEKILLPIDALEKVEEWKPLHPDFADAIGIVQQCAGTDQTAFKLTCVHIHPKWLEACDNFQMTRYKIKTGITESTLVRQSAIKNIVAFGMSEFAETPSWLHFRNPGGLMLSCRRYVEEYDDLAPYLQVEGKKAQLPKGLADAIEKAEIFSSEDSERNEVMVMLRPGKLRIRGLGNTGWYSESKKVGYKGPPINFMIAPKLLKDLTERHNECEISEDRLKVNGGRFVYVACLGKADDA